MKRILILFLMGLALAAAAGAQEKPAAAAPSADAAKPAPAPVASAKFQAEYDKFLTLAEARNAADRKRAEYEAAVKVLDEQLADVRKSLLAQIPQDYTWDAARRAFVKRPEPPAAEKPQGEKP